MYTSKVQRQQFVDFMKKSRLADATSRNYAPALWIQDHQMQKIAKKWFGRFKLNNGEVASFVPPYQSFEQQQQFVEYLLSQSLKPTTVTNYTKALTDKGYANHETAKRWFQRFMDYQKFAKRVADNPLTPETIAKYTGQLSSALKATGKHAVQPTPSPKPSSDSTTPTDTTDSTEQSDHVVEAIELILALTIPNTTILKLIKVLIDDSL